MLHALVSPPQNSAGSYTIHSSLSRHPPHPTTTFCFFTSPQKRKLKQKSRQEYHNCWFTERLAPTWTEEELHVSKWQLQVDHSLINTCSLQMLVKLLYLEKVLYYHKTLNYLVGPLGFVWVHNPSSAALFWVLHHSKLNVWICTLKLHIWIWAAA